MSTAFSRSSNSPRYFAPAISAPMSSAISCLSLSALRHVAIDDAQGQALGDRRLADAGLADQHRIVLGAARQHLDGAADLVVAADDRIELAFARIGGQVTRIFLQGVVSPARRGAESAVRPLRMSLMAWLSACARHAGLRQDARRSSPTSRWPAPAAGARR